MRKRRTVGVLFGGIAFTVAASCASREGGAGAPPGDSPSEPGSQTGATASIPDKPEASLTIEEYLRGQVPGLEIIPGRDGGFRLRIRGIDPSLRENVRSQQPLVIIDDMPLSDQAASSALANLSPSDIQKVQVLKDVASTSIYGSRGAAGVLLIWTREE